MQNLTRIEIENFQSIDFLSIPLSNTGVHWINGKPNVGKSAILKATQALFTNVSNNRYKEMIRDGEDAFRVKGYFGEDDWVELIRGEDDRYSWAVEGRAGTLTKTQGRVPYELRQYYDLYWTGDKIKRYLNFTMVGDQLFFVETSSGDNTLILEKALGTDRLTRVGKYAESEKRDIRSELRTIRTFHEEADVKLERLIKEVEDGTDVLSGLDRLAKTLDTEVHTYEKVEKLVEKISSLANIAQVVKSVEDNLSKVDSRTLQSEIEEFDKVNTLYEKSVKLDDLEQELAGLAVNVTRQELKSLEEEVNEYHKVSEKADKLIKAKETQRLLTTSLEETALKYQELLKEKEDFLGQFEVCPFCERPMGSEHGAC